MPQTAEPVSFLELVRAGWPILAFIMMTAYGALQAVFDTRQNRTTIRECFSALKEEIKHVENDFHSFKNGDYKHDRKDLLAAIDEVKAMQRVSEKKIEDKLDRMGSATESKLDRLTETMNQINLSLAEIRGRSYAKPDENKRA